MKKFVKVLDEEDDFRNINVDHIVEYYSLNGRAIIVLSTESIVETKTSIVEIDKQIEKMEA